MAFSAQGGTTHTMIFPPSPALSAYDSVDGIEDLDAFLDSQGGLSHFPTPPMRNDPRTDAIELSSEDCDQFPHITQDLAIADPIATAFAHVASLGAAPTLQDVDIIRHILVRADLPLEVIAIAFAMLSSLEAGSRTLGDCSPDLLVLAALSLAVSYTDDHAPLPSWYSTHVSNNAHTTQRVNQMALRLLAALGWHIYKFATPEAYAQAMTAFCTSAAVHSVQNRSFQMESLELRLKFPRRPVTRWERNSLTPDDTPPASASGNMLACAQLLPPL